VLLESHVLREEECSTQKPSKDYHGSSLRQQVDGQSLRELSEAASYPDFLRRTV